MPERFNRNFEGNFNRNNSRRPGGRGSFSRDGGRGAGATGGFSSGERSERGGREFRGGFGRSTSPDFKREKREQDRKPWGKPSRSGASSSYKPKFKQGVRDSQATQDSRPARPVVPDDVCWGRGPVLDLVKTSPDRCTRLLIANNVRPPYLDELVDAARAGRVVYQLVAPEALDRLCPGERHQGVACRLTEVKPVELEPFLRSLDKTKPALLVVLDHIEDPHNVGAIVRSAECGGAAAVIYSKRREALPGGTVAKTSAGASLRLPMISVVNIARTLEQLQTADFWVAGLEGRAETNIWSDKLPKRLAIVIGAEGEGLSRLVSESCDQLLRIPITGGVGSLNASVAAALGIFEWRRSVSGTNE